MNDTGSSSRSSSPGDDRDRTADDRDRTSEGHDETAQARDVESEARDSLAEAREQDEHDADTQAASDRAEAKRDRQGSAGDRRHAGRDRDAASADRIYSADERADFLLDGLTGAHRRESGLLELEREVGKAHRTGTSFVLAFVDIDGLKTLNDSQGHAAGDQLLSQVVEALRAVMREYDLIVRYGGDEFLCGLADLEMADAGRRFIAANASLGTRQAHVTVGLAELASDESLAGLIARADAGMYSQRKRRRTR